METLEPELIGACCKCDKIRIDLSLFIRSTSLWLGRNENAELYDELIKGKYLTHGYCPQHFNEAMEEVERYKEESGLSS